MFRGNHFMPAVPGLRPPLTAAEIRRVVESSVDIFLRGATRRGESGGKGGARRRGDGGEGGLKPPLHTYVCSGTLCLANMADLSDDAP